MSQDLIALALKLLSCTQKELSTILNVSPTQISKWKKGEYMSFESSDKLKKILMIGDLDPGTILITGSIKNAEKWEKLITFIAELAEKQVETGYRTAPLIDETDLLTSTILHLLQEIGIQIPETFPVQYDLDYQQMMNSDDDEKYDDLMDNINTYSITKIIYQTFLALNGIYGFYIAYIDPITFNDDLEFLEELSLIENCLLDLALCKADISDITMPKFPTFKANTLQQYREWINVVKQEAFLANVSLKAEIMDLVSRSHDEVGHSAERESLGFNDNMIHPDIYMNELLQGMRLIHQVLPVIMEKLEIKDFKIDESDLRA